MAEEQEQRKRIARVEVDRQLCIGAATCVALAAGAFELDAENKSKVKEGWQNVDEATLRLAAESCPTKAIKLFDEEGKQLYP